MHYPTYRSGLEWTDHKIHPESDLVQQHVSHISQAVVLEG